MGRSRIILQNITVTPETDKSITVFNDSLQLVNDEQSPGADKVYGTDGSGVKGWQDVDGGGGTWGSITGTLSNQTDLQTALDLKANTSALGSAAFVATSAFDAAGSASAALTSAQTYADGKVIDSIADSDTTHAPSRNSVFDALALKRNLSDSSALTRADDTNVTLTLGGSPSSALLAATSLTLGWSGTLAYSRFVNGAGLSVVGRSTNSAGVQADIVAANDAEVLRRSGTSIGFGSINLASSGAVGSSILPIANGGSGSTTAVWWTLTGSSTLSTPVLTGFPTFRMDNITTTKTDGILLENSTAATGSVTVQYSPAFHQRGKAWKTSGSTQDLDFRWSVVPVSGTTISGSLALDVQVEGTGYTNLYSFSSGSVFTAGVGTNGTITASGAGGNINTQTITRNSNSASFTLTGSSNAFPSIDLITASPNLTSSVFLRLSPGTFGLTSGSGYAKLISFAQTINVNSAYTGDFVLLDDNNTYTSVTGLTLYGFRLPNTSMKSGLGTATPTSTLHIAGSFAGGYVAKTATYTATLQDYTIECTANTFTVTLPTAVGITGRVYNIINSGAGTITIDTTSSQTFVNVTATPTTLTMVTIGTTTVQSNGTNWIKISGI